GLVLATADLSDLVRDPQRALTPLVVVFGLVTFLGALLASIGVFFYIFIPGLSPDLARRGYGSHRTSVAIIAAGMIAGAVLGLPFLLLTGQLPRLGVGNGGMAPLGLGLAIIGSQLGLLLVTWWRVLRHGLTTPRMMGVVGMAPGRLVKAGVVTWLAMLTLVAVVSLALRQIGVQQTQQAMFSPVTDATGWEFLIILFGGGVMAPVVEETLFRGYIFRAYLETKGATAAFFYSALFFTVVHFNLPALLPIFIVGLVLAYAFHATRSVIPSMIAHSLNNSVALTVIYLGLV
ncbi:MAG TPA: type II CAAX endopeptidase family protein, partial [Chloroflexota bacterium]|nr:type II CAAX endopeptidase family protein [Chloroflexota bacterium]